MRLPSPAALAGILTLLTLVVGAPVHAAGALDGTTAIAANPYGSGVSGAMVARFGSELPVALRRAGFVLMDPRQVDIKLGERPELLVSCQDQACYLAQAQLLQVEHLVVPQLRLDNGRLAIELVLYDTVQEAGKPGLAAVARAQETCLVGELSSAILRAVAALKQGAERARWGEVVVKVMPEGARVFLDGEEIGKGGPEPLRRALPPGEHHIEARGASGRAERKLTLSTGQHMTVDLLAAVSEPAPAPIAPRRTLATAKWVTFGIGLAAVAVGTTLWALDGSGTCNKIVGQLECPRVLDTFPAGIATLSVGAAGLGVSAVLFGLDARRAHEQRESQAPGPAIVGGAF